ncbi:tubulin-folding cofactor B isoform X2 [Eurosta solidaginis]|uniref:tubulin-folding cofactor B isoform X2 n=1 Tax=Eurosta solidaginis TaxID=178769 RepID=UPI003531546F
MEALQINSGEEYVKVNVSNSKTDGIALDLKFAKNLTVGELKCKLEIITGGNAGTMQLELYSGDRLVTKLSDDNILLGALPIETGMRIHVIDSFNWITDVEKFELTDEQYATKEDTLRDFLKKNRLGKYNEEEAQQREEKLKRQKQFEQERAELCAVGARCQVTVAGNPVRRGTVRYNGPIEGKNGIFIGVEYDEPLGKNNGSLYIYS